VRASHALLAAAAALTLATPVAAAEELGTLFFTREERAALDRLRRGEPQTQVARVARHAVTGFVRRSDGRNTVWIDGSPVPITGAAPEAILAPQASHDGAQAGRGVRIERKKTR
jgi:hypothetical protein